MPCYNSRAFEGAANGKHAGAMMNPAQHVNNFLTDHPGHAFCDDCIAKVAGHGVDDKRCSKSIIHQSQQAVLKMFKSEVKKFDDGVVEPSQGT